MSNDEKKNKFENVMRSLNRDKGMDSAVQMMGEEGARRMMEQHMRGTRRKEALELAAGLHASGAHDDGTTVFDTAERVYAFLYGDE